MELIECSDCRLIIGISVCFPWLHGNHAARACQCESGFLHAEAVRDETRRLERAIGAAKNQEKPATMACHDGSRIGLLFVRREVLLNQLNPPGEPGLFSGIAQAGGLLFQQLQVSQQGLPPALGGSGFRSQFQGRGIGFLAHHQQAGVE
ncbi:MAG: hypothetical protein M1449_13335, partial [Candidatus Thermoplasmatota archaeon]|nr:hypothetical protein [Candidatus Thermoplasmatota archaeon]